MRKVVIVSAARTPIGSFLGSLLDISAITLGSIALQGAIKKINLDPKLVQEVFFGNALQAGLGQAPARQVSIKSGISNSVPCSTINKVCASGIKSIIIGAQSIFCHDNDIVAVGGMENMSQVPFYLKSIRNGKKLGNQILIDGLLSDGLVDAYYEKHMGSCAELCAEKYGISREEQDEFTLESYRRSKNAWVKGKFQEEVIPVTVFKDSKKLIVLSEDEEYKNINFDKISLLPTVFKKNGTITAANSSTLNDGASALILMLEEKANELGIKPLARIISYVDYSNEPLSFTTAPAKAIIKLLNKVKLSIDQIDYFEINEAFSVVVLANQKLLGINSNKLNVNGGAVSLGHPLGSSGSRIVVTLINILKQNNSHLGIVAICNGGGEASALIIENLN